MQGLPILPKAGRKGVQGFNFPLLPSSNLLPVPPTEKLWKKPESSLSIDALHKGDRERWRKVVVVKVQMDNVQYEN